MMTATASTWRDLARRCREATGADREIDADIYRALGAKVLTSHVQHIVYWGEIGGEYEGAAKITASIDAAVSLIERELPGWSGAVHFGDYGEEAKKPFRHWANLNGPDFHDDQEAEAATPALALCACLCEAMASLAEKESASAPLVKETMEP